MYQNWSWTRTEHIYNLKSSDFGNKAYNLSVVHRAGYHIPKSVIVPHSLIVVQAGQLVLPVNWDDFCSNIVNHFKEFKKIIIRSNTNFEDSNGLALAGVFDSIIVPVHNENELKAGIKKAIEINYRKEKVHLLEQYALNIADLKVSLLIQGYYDADVGGVGFSRNPKNPWSEEGLVELSSLGPEKVVEGNSNTSIENLKDSPHKDVFNALSKLEDKYNFPIEIEWLKKDGILIVLQCRKITSEWAKLCRTVSVSTPLNREDSQERFPNRITPLSWSSLQDALVDNVKSLEEEFGIVIKDPSQIAINYEGWVYSNPRAFKLSYNLEFKWVKVFKFKFLFNALKNFIQIPYWVASYKLKGIYSIAKLELIRSFFINSYSKLDSNWNIHIDTFLKELDVYRKSPVFPLLKRFEYLRSISLKLLKPDFVLFLMREAYYSALKECWKKSGKNENDLLSILQSLNGNKTIEYKKALDHLIKDPNEYQVASFIEKYGHVALSWDFRVPTVGEQILKILKTSFSKKDIKSKNTSPLIGKIKSLYQNPKIKARGGRRIPYMSTTKQRRDWSFGIGSELNNYWQLRINELKSIMEMDEDLHFYSGYLVQSSRELILETANQWVKRGLLFDKDDIFFLNLNFIKKNLKQCKVSPGKYAQLKKSQWMRNESREPHPTIPPANNENTQSKETIGSNCGRAKGPPYYLEKLENFDEVPEGSILITPSPNPALVTVFNRISGLVTLSGGPLSHGLIAAREFHLPVVCRAKNIQSMLNAKELIIDSDSGEIEAVNEL